MTPFLTQTPIGTYGGQQLGGVENVSMNVHETLHARVGQQRKSGHMQTRTTTTKHNNNNKSNNNIFRQPLPSEAN